MWSSTHLTSIQTLYNLGSHTTVFNSRMGCVKWKKACASFNLQWNCFSTRTSHSFKILLCLKLFATKLQGTMCIVNEMSVAVNMQSRHETSFLSISVFPKQKLCQAWYYVHKRHTRTGLVETVHREYWSVLSVLFKAYSIQCDWN